MSLKRIFFIFLLLFIFQSCSSNLTFSPQEMLSYSGHKTLPTQTEFPDDGAVILFENIDLRVFIGTDRRLGYKNKFHQAILYFNDKAEDFLAPKIYLGNRSILEEFSARTIKPNGEILELNKDDLYPTQIKPDFIEFSDDKSVKFTFPGVEPGAILEYSYIVKNSGSFFGGNIWKIQSTVPKLYSGYSIEVPVEMLKAKFNWNYIPTNIDLGAPQKQKGFMQERSGRDKSIIYSWNIKDISPIIIEPQMPPYYDIAQYMRITWQYKSWEKLTKAYWNIIKDRFNPKDQDQIKQLALDIIDNAPDEQTKIERIFNYTQKNYRYVAMSIKQSGYIPHYPEDIIKKKYGDCKDMSVLNIVLLKSLGIDAYPALVNTKNAGEKKTDIISLDFNHMITYVKDKNNNEYWLDATGSSCPLGEVYPAIEGVAALVFSPDGKAEFKTIPLSESYQNRLIRHLILNIKDNGIIEGYATLKFSGNENISFRSSFKDANPKDIKKVIESYVNSNTANLRIDSLVYDDPSEITKEFSVKFYLCRQDTISKSTNFLIIKPGIFKLDSELDNFLNIERNYPIMYLSPYKITDFVEIQYNPEKYRVESMGNKIIKKYKFGRLLVNYINSIKGKIKYQREYILEDTKIYPINYSSFRDLHKAIVASNDENIIFRKIE